MFLQIQGGKLNEEIMVIVLKALKPHAGKDKEAEYREGIAECNEKSKCRYIHTYIHTYVHIHTYIHIYIHTYIPAYTTKVMSSNEILSGQFIRQEMKPYKSA